MARKRSVNRSLTETRIYIKGNRYYYFSATEIVNPDSGKAAKWHSLCLVKEGELKARKLANRIIQHNTQDIKQGDMPIYLAKFMSNELKKREKTKPTDPERVKMFETRNKDLISLNNVLIKVFFEFNVSEVLPVDIALFLDSYNDRLRMAQVYRSQLSKFFKWMCRTGVRHDNPVENVNVEPPEKRDVYITDEQFLAITKATLTDKKGSKVPTGEMAKAYIELCYLMYQRTTELRLLKWCMVSDEGIYFKPTKTERKSNVDVIVPMTPAIKKVLDSVRGLYDIESEYVFYKKDGKPFEANGLRASWDRACARVGLEGVTLKDLRAKALTDASRKGFKIEQLSIGAAHTDTKTTSGYIKIKDTPISEVNLDLPEA